MSFIILWDLDLVKYDTVDEIFRLSSWGAGGGVYQFQYCALGINFWVPWFGGYTCTIGKAKALGG